MASEITGKLVDLYARVQRHDRDLEWQSHQRIRADYDDASAYQKSADTLDDLAREFRREFPDHPDMADALDRAARRMIRDSGQIYGMAQSRDTYGSGWGEQWDVVLSTIRGAIDITNNDSLTGRLIDLYGRLQREDRDLEWNEVQNQRATYADADQYESTGSRYDRIARDFGYEHPEATWLADDLNSSARRVIRDAGQIYDMAQSRETYGSGWGEQWDGALSTLRRAISYLLRPAE